MKISGYFAIIVYMHTVTGQDDCHCLNGNGCQNHVCNSGCNNGWSGPSCQRKNIALRFAFQSACNEVDCSLGANLSIDGDIRTHNKSLCSKTGLNQVSASLTVILETRKQIDRIGLYFVDDYVKEMVDFQILVDDGLRKTLCYQQPNTAPVTSHVEIACQQQIGGIYVTVVLPPVNNKPRVLRLCEIEIYECANLWWGGKCAKKCNNCPGDTAYCNMRSGQCSSRDGSSSAPATTMSPTTANISSTSFKIMETSVSTSSVKINQSASVKVFDVIESRIPASVQGDPSVTTDGNISLASCVIINGTQPSWKVTFDKQHIIDGLQLYIPHSAELTTFSVLIEGTLCYHRSSSVPIVTPYRFQCFDKLIGHSVTIFVPQAVSMVSLALCEVEIYGKSDSAKTTESIDSNPSDGIPIPAIVVPCVIAVIIGVVVVIIVALRHRGYCCANSKENQNERNYAGLDRKPENNYTTLTPPTYQNEPGPNTYENVQIQLEGRHS